MSGSVPSANGTGVRLFSGILSVVDVSGNNECTFSANSIVLGNTVAPITYNLYGAAGSALNLNLLTQVNDALAPTLTLNVTSAPLNQKASLLRMNASGSFAISSATDAAAGTPVLNLLSGVRAGTSWTILNFGDPSGATAFNFVGTGVVTAPKFQTLAGSTGPFAVSGTLSGVTLLPAGYAVYLASATITNSGDPGNYNCTAIISTNLNSSKVTIIQSAALMNFSTSGLQVYATQSSGATATIDWVLTRIA